MPTALPRFQVTETPEVQRALAAAEQAWPELARSERVKRLLLQGADALNNEERAAERQRRFAEDVSRSAGMFTGLYEPDHLQNLREEWPE